MILVDSQDASPIYEQVYRRIRTLIMTEALKEGEQLPSVRSLAMELSINPNTIQRAYSLLEQEKLVYVVKGRGNFVAHNDEIPTMKRKQFIEKCQKIIREARQMGLTGEEISRDAVASVWRKKMIEIKHITKSFDGCKAVEDVSVTIKEGQVFGLIGTNGAGKSTTLRIMNRYHETRCG